MALAELRRFLHIPGTPERQKSANGIPAAPHQSPEERRAELKTIAAFLEETEGDIPEEVLGELDYLNARLAPPPTRAE